MTISTIKKNSVLKAIKVLRNVNEKHFEDCEKKPLFEDDRSTLLLQVMLKKIPNRKSIQMIKVNLPHSVIKDTDEICLITGDLDKRNRKADIEPDVLHYKALLDKHGITQVSKIVTLRQLRTEYKPYREKQKLLAAYDVFLSDNRITECLPIVLGKFMFKKRKYPIQINLKTPNLKQQIERALSTKMFYITGHGNSCSTEVANLDMADSEIVDNVIEMTKVLAEKAPGAWDNIMGLYLKTAKSQAIPVYMSYDNPNDIVLDEDEEEDEIIVDEISTQYNVGVKVHKDGTVIALHLRRLQEENLLEASSENVESTFENEDTLEIETPHFESSQERNCEEEKNLETQSEEHNKKSVEETKQIPCDEIDNSPDFLENVPRKEKSPIKNAMDEMPPREKRKKSQKEIPCVEIDSSSDIVERKKKKLLAKNATNEMTPKETRKKSQKEIPCVEIDSSSDNVQSKKKKLLAKNALNEMTPKEDSVGGKKKTAVKRKRISESVIPDLKECKNDSNTPKQEVKKRKMDITNTSRPQSIKNTCKRKKQRTVQQKL